MIIMENWEEFKRRQEIKEELKNKLRWEYSREFTYIKEVTKSPANLDASQISDLMLKVIRQIAFIYNYPWDDEIYVRYKGETFKWSNMIRRDIDTVLKILESRSGRNKIDDVYSLLLIKTEISQEHVDFLQNYAVTKNLYILDRKTGEFLKPNYENILRFYSLFQDELWGNEEIRDEVSKLEKLIKVSSMSKEDLDKEIKKEEELVSWKGDSEDVKEEKEYLAILRMVRDWDMTFSPQTDLSGISEFKDLWDKLVSILPFPHRLNVDYNPSAKAPRWEKFLKEVLPDTKFHTSLKRFSGYLLYNGLFTHVPNITIFVGDGNNGKGVFLSTLEDILGESNYSTVMLQDIKRRFGNLDLITAMLNIAGDLPNKPITDTGFLKAITGGDPVPFEPKYKKPFKKKVNVKHVFSANELPKTGDKSYGFYRRWLIFIFPKIFKGDEIDPWLREKLSKEKEGIFNWMLEGLREFLRELDFAYPLSVEEVRDIYETASNSLLRFLQEECEESPGDVISVDEFYKLYTMWCAEKSLTPLKSSGEVSKQITSLGTYIERPSNPVRIRGELKRVYKNIKVKYIPPEERNLFVEENKSIEDYEEEDFGKVWVRFLQDWSYDHRQYRTGMEVGLYKDVARRLTMQGIVEPLDSDLNVKVRALDDVRVALAKESKNLNKGETGELPWKVAKILMQSGKVEYVDEYKEVSRR